MSGFLAPNQTMLYCHLLIHAEIYIYILDTYRRNDNRCSNKRHRKTSLTILPLTLFVRFERVVQCLRVRGCWRPNITSIVWPHCYDRHVVSFSFLDAQPEALGSLCWMLAFFMASYQHLLWTPNSIKAKRPLWPDVAFLTTFPLQLSGTLLVTPLAPWASNSTGTRTQFPATANCKLCLCLCHCPTSVLSALYNSSTPTRSPTGSLKSNV